MAIDAHEYDMIGEFKIEGLATLPAWGADDEKRLVYALDENKFYLGLGDAWQEIQFTGHADDHLSSGDDEINGDRVEVSFTPTYYTPSGGEIRGHLNGIDDALPTYTDTYHPETHITDGSDEINGDRVEIDFIPSHYIPSGGTVRGHLNGIDTAISTLSTDSHASTHITDGIDEIDGDKLNIVWTPSNYSVDVSPSEATSITHLTAHLAGIDNALVAGEDIKGWVSFYDSGDDGNISGGEIKDSHNVNAITRNGDGDYTIVWEDDFENDDYVVVANSLGATYQYVVISDHAVGSVKVTTKNVSTNATANSTQNCFVMAIGDA